MEDSKTLKFPEEELPETESAADSVTETEGADIPLRIHHRINYASLGNFSEK